MNTLEFEGSLGSGSGLERSKLRVPRILAALSKQSNARIPWCMYSVHLTSLVIFAILYDAATRCKLWICLNKPGSGRYFDPWITRGCHASSERKASMNGARTDDSAIVDMVSALW